MLARIVNQPNLKIAPWNAICFVFLFAPAVEMVGTRKCYWGSEIPAIPG